MYIFFLKSFPASYFGNPGEPLAALSQKTGDADKRVGTARTRRGSANRI
ncbi:MAG: hypothetical protein H7Z72_23040 [Bacteroidetes bacterium]|nr:hypothetical protein [Fibrella sp.]